MPHDYSEDQLIQCSTTEARDRLLPKLMGGEMDDIFKKLSSRLKGFCKFEAE